jgi:dTDP-4-dehydrorhamnose 3,5-epimerase
LWYAAGFSAKNHSMLYVPKGSAHGSQTLEDDAEVFYMMGECYYEESARGMRWDDEQVGIAWPIDISIMSQQDKLLPMLLL